MRSVCSQLTSSSLSCGRFLNGLCGMSNVLSNSGGEETVFGCRFTPHNGGDEWSLAGTRLFHWFGRENDLGRFFWGPQRCPTELVPRFARVFRVIFRRRRPRGSAGPA